MAELGLVVGGGHVLADDIDLDFLEPTIMGRFVGQDESGASVALDAPTAQLIDRPIRGGAVLFPGTFRLADPDFDMTRVTDHLAAVASSLSAAAEPGAWVVFGSGASRRIDDDIEREVALARLAEVMAEGHRILGAAGLELLLEPLRQLETNVFNSLAEGTEFLDAHALPLRMVCDTYHVMSENGTAADAVAHLDRIGHVHLSGRDRLPVSQDADAVLEIATALQEAGYQGRWSFECSWPEPDDLADSIAVTRQRLS